MSQQQTHFKTVPCTLNTILSDIDMGELGLPDLQRPFVWKKSKIRDLFDSMYRGYPIGYLLLWAHSDPTRSRSIGTEKRPLTPHKLVIDGQQRLTSLYSVLKCKPVKTAEFEDVRIKIAFHPLEEKFDVANAAIDRDIHWIPDISAVWSTSTDIFDFVDDYLERLGNEQDVDNNTKKQVRHAIQKLQGLQNFPLTYLELSGQLDEEQVADVFVRINSKGKKLNQADFILTLLSVHWEDGRRQLEAFCSRAKHPSKDKKPSPYNPFFAPQPDQLIRTSVGLAFRRARLQYVYSVLRGKDLDTGEFSDERRDEQFERLKDAQAKVLDLSNWGEFLNILVKAGYRRRKEISSSNALLYTYLMFLIGRCDLGIGLKDLKPVIARWFFFVSLTGRYTGSAESQMEQDLAALREMDKPSQFLEWIDHIIATTFTDDFWNISLPQRMATSSARSPELFAYYAALNLLNAKVLFSTVRVPELLDPVSQPKRQPLERHHLFPRGYLKSLGITEKRLINRIANMAILEWPDNTAISDQAPADYAPPLFEGLNTEDSEQIRFWHALPEGWEKLEYRDFLEVRERGIAKVIKAGFELLRGSRSRHFLEKQA